MRQRVMIALALAVKPRLLIADEPTTALDVVVRSSILELFGELRRERNLALVIVSHDIGAIASATDKIAVMYAGQSVETGRTGEVLANPRHPYTRALLATMPQRTPTGKPLPVVAGQPPRPGDHGGGCAFADRCPAVMPACRTEAPAPAPVPGDGRVTCLRVGRAETVTHREAEGSER
jgi:oligopeptide/dipeptide ABC transporter ATP-binding protein